MYDETKVGLEAQSEVISEGAKYSDFAKTQKRWILFLVAFAGLFSPLSTFIYYPAIPTIVLDLGITVTLVNLTIYDCVWVHTSNRWRLGRYARTKASLSRYVPRLLRCKHRLGFAKILSCTPRTENAAKRRRFWQVLVYGELMFRT